MADTLQDLEDRKKLLLARSQLHRLEITLASRSLRRSLGTPATVLSAVRGNAVIADTEKLLKALAASGVDKGNALRDSAEQSLAAARERLGELQDEAYERSRAAVRATDDYVRDNPWQAIGIAAGVALLAGLVIGLATNRR